MKSYLKRLLLGIDQLGNTILGGFADETISARAGRLRNKPGVLNHIFWRPLAWTLNKLDRHHVEDAIGSERKGTQQDPAYSDVYDPEDANGRSH
jgi:hypothetical protein